MTHLLKVYSLFHIQSTNMRLKSFLLAAFFVIGQINSAEAFIHNPASSLPKAAHQTGPSLMSRIKEKAVQLLMKRSLHRFQKKHRTNKGEQLGLITGPASMGLLIAAIGVSLLGAAGTAPLAVSLLAVAMLAAIMTLLLIPGRKKGETLSEKAQTARTLGKITFFTLLVVGLIALIVASISFEIV